MSLNIRPARASDYDALIGSGIQYRSYAYVAEDDGKVIAAGGFAILNSGAAQMFLHAEPEAIEKHRMLACRMARRVIAEAKKRGFYRIVAECDFDRPKAKRFLEWLGFVDEGEIFAYEGK